MLVKTWYFFDVTRSQGNRREEKKPREECTGTKGRKALHSLEFRRNMYVEYVEPTKDQIWLAGDVHSRDMIGPRHRR